jgi:hypothetical protein
MQHHYFIAIKAPGIKPEVLEQGNWVLMDATRDLDRTARRFAMLQKVLGQEGKVCVMSAPSDNPGAVRVMGLYHTNNSPKLAEIVKASDKDRLDFWEKVEKLFPEGRQLHYRDVMPGVAGARPPEYSYAGMTP